MIRRNRIYIRLVTIWLLMLGGAMSPVQAYQPVNQPATWRTTPTLSTDNCPSYQFRSTSTYAPIVGHTSYLASEPYNPSQASSPHKGRKDYNPWDENFEDDENDPYQIGVTDDHAPIGSPLVLLLMAVLYIFYTNRKKIYEKFAYLKKKQ